MTLWGTRGSLATPGPDTARYGGNTSCVGVAAAKARVLVLDAGTGIRRMAATTRSPVRRVDVLLTHLHRITSRGWDSSRRFTAPISKSTSGDPQRARCAARAPDALPFATALSVSLRELPSHAHVAEVPCGELDIGEFRVYSASCAIRVPTVGYRIAEGQARLTYLPDHEPALGTWHSRRCRAGGLREARSPPGRIS